MLEKSLEKIGISAEESRLYLTLLSSGTVSAGALAKSAGIPRPSVYVVLKRLILKGLVTETQQSGVKRFVPIHPDRIADIFSDYKAEIESAEQQYRESLKQVREIVTDSYLSPKLELYESADGLEKVLKDMLLYRDVETEALWPIETMVDVLSPEFFRKHNQERIKRNISVRAIWPENQVVNFKKHPYLGAGSDFKREIRSAPNNIDFSMGYWIYGNKIAFLSSRKEGFGFIVESGDLAKTLRSQFDLVWKRSDEVRTKEDDVKEFIETLK